MRQALRSCKELDRLESEESTIERTLLTGYLVALLSPRGMSRGQAPSQPQLAFIRFRMASHAGCTRFREGRLRDALACAHSFRASSLCLDNGSSRICLPVAA